MFCNAYVILALGNIEPILKVSDSGCWGKEHPDCSVALRSAVAFSVFVGLIAGMLAGGYIGDAFGRRKGSLMTVSAMMLGNILIVASDLPSETGTFTMFSVALAIFGFGVGGEYPLTAASSAEKAEIEREERDARMAAGHHIEIAPDRGMKVVLPFSMQGIGNLVNTFVILMLLLGFSQTDPAHYDGGKLTLVWRLQYAFGLLPLLFLIIYRFLYLHESGAWEKLRSQASSDNTKVFAKYYWHRMIGTALGWFVWDMTFYGNKIFQTKFISLFVQGNDIVEILIYTLINAGIAYLGYLAAAVTVDRHWMGRCRMQLMGFTVMALCFGVCIIWYDWLVTKDGLPLLQVLYYATTFWGQWGPNSTTYAFAAEVYPTHIRAVANGLSGGCGKLGALVGAIAFSLVDSRVAFCICTGCGFVGLIVTLLFLPDVTRMGLDENDKFWMVLKTTAETHRCYEGEYSHYLSWFEKHFWWDQVFHKAPPTDQDNEHTPELSDERGLLIS